MICRFENRITECQQLEGQAAVDNLLGSLFSADLLNAEHIPTKIDVWKVIMINTKTMELFTVIPFEEAYYNIYDRETIRGKNVKYISRLTGPI